MSCCAVETKTSSCGLSNGTKAEKLSPPSVLGDAKTYDLVQDYYGKVLSTSEDLKTNACSAGGAPHPYLKALMKSVPKEIMAKFYGCGAPVPLGITGLRVLDLGSGSGRDCYLSALLVGEKGFVTGVDMTDEQLDISKEYVDDFCTNAGYGKPNMKFIKGHMEYLDKAGVEDESVDIVISNCTVNLSPNKHRVLSEAYRALAPGGEFYFSDVYADRRLPEEARKNEALWGEGLSGSLYFEDFKRLARETGFADPRELSRGPIVIRDPYLLAVTGDAKFYSITYRLFKAPGLLEPTNEDYGQYAIYKGTIKGHENAYDLDENNRFVKGKPALVSGNTAAMLGENNVSWLSPHFQVVGDRSVHYGLMESQTRPAASGPPAPPAASGGCC
ncbi:hypothetical protein BSKO_07966 [Bryopsis sp. KO-2023]|nr:hypothetical protein BSKO_07966 [Bryopsis sp. KO-2023]